MKKTTERDPSLIALGAALRSLREKAQLSQEELAARAGIHHNHLSSLERGHMNATYKTLVRIASALGTPLSKWVGEAERPRMARSQNSPSPPASTSNRK